MHDGEPVACPIMSYMNTGLKRLCGTPIDLDPVCLARKHTAEKRPQQTCVSFDDIVGPLTSQRPGYLHLHCCV